MGQVLVFVKPTVLGDPPTRACVKITRSSVYYEGYLHWFFWMRYKKCVHNSVEWAYITKRQGFANKTLAPVWYSPEDAEKLAAYVRENHTMWFADLEQERPE